MVVVARRLVNLHLGLLTFGLSIALMVRAELGLASWDVLHQGVVRGPVCGSGLSSSSSRLWCWCCGCRFGSALASAR